MALLTGALGLSFASGCSKANDVDVNNGALSAGEECSLTPEDPCAGACIGGTCRAPCGSNRECPSGMQCIGDGEQSGCVPSEFGELDLLTDCADGCTGELAPFGREGYFWRCEGEYRGDTTTDYLYEINGLLAFGAPDFEPEVWCSTVTSRTFAVKDDIVYDSWGQSFEDNCEWAHAGVVGDQFVRHGCLRLEFDEGYTSVAEAGYLYYSSGNTYLLSERGLFKFQAEAVTDSLTNCDSFAAAFGWGDAPECPAPTFPALGDIPTRAVGFWAMCPSIDNGPNLWPTYDVEACATLAWGEGAWDAYADVLLVRDDGYIVDARASYFYYQACTGAVRGLGGDPASVAVISRRESTLQLEAEQWDVFEQSGETFLRTRQQGSATSGYVLRKLPPPPELSHDPCDALVPSLGF